MGETRDNQQAKMRTQTRRASGARSQPSSSSTQGRVTTRAHTSSTQSTYTAQRAAKGTRSVPRANTSTTTTSTRNTTSSPKAPRVDSGIFSHPAMRFIGLPLLVTAAFVLIGVAVSCNTDFAVM